MQEDVYEILRNARLKAGISRKQLADMVGCSERAVTYWESGEREMTLKHADAICTALGIEMTIGKRNLPSELGAATSVSGAADKKERGEQ